MEMLEFLLFIAIIAVIFGVSMHQAFWGLIAFLALLVLGIIAYFVAWYFYQRIAIKVEFMKSPTGKAIRKTKREIRKRKIIEDIISALMVLWLFSPLLIGVLIAMVFKEFSENHPFATFAIASSPIWLSFIAFILINKKRTK